MNWCTCTSGGLLKNCNAVSFLVSYSRVAAVQAVSYPQSVGIHAARAHIIARVSAQTSVMDRYLPAAHKGHHFCKNFTKYSVPSLSFGWNMIFNMLHKCSWLFLVWNLRLLKIEEEKGEFVVCYHSLYVLLYVGLSQFPLHGEISRMRTS